MKPNREDGWATEWLAPKLADNSAVASVEQIDANHMKVIRKDGGPVYVAAISVSRLSGADLEDVLASDIQVDLVVNIPRDAVVMGDALEVAKARRVPVFGMGDAMSALNKGNPSEHVPREVEFVERILRQHSVVVSLERLDSARYRLDRGDLSTVTVLVLNEYDLTAERIRWAIDTFDAFDAIATSNPNARLSGAATTAAASAGTKVFLFKELLSELHRPWT